MHSHAKRRGISKASWNFAGPEASLFGRGTHGNEALTSAKVTIGVMASSGEASKPSVI